MNQVVVAKQDVRMPQGRAARTRGLLLASTALVGVAAAMLPLVPYLAGPAFAAGGAGGNTFPANGTPGTGGADLANGPVGAPGTAGANGAGGGGGGSGFGGGRGGDGSGGAAGGAAAVGGIFGGNLAAQDGTPGGAAGQGGGGGGGGSASLIPSIGINGSQLVGLAGGAGGAGNGSGGGGGGGAGGAGVLISNGLGQSVDVSGGGSLTAGAGGAGGASSGGFGGNGGTGGIGADFLSATGTVTVGAGSTLSGGAGGAGGSGATIDQGGGSQLILNGFGGANGAGIRGSNLTITNSGTIQGGGLNNPNGVEVLALSLTGGTNVITYGNATSGLGGDVLISSGTIQMNAAGNGTTIANTIKGGGGLIQNSANTLTLTGNNFYLGTTTIAAGVLEANSSSALGSGTSTNTLIFNGGTLRAIGTITSPATRGVTLTGTGTIDTNGNDVSIAGVIAGVGALTKSGGGILSLTGLNQNSGSVIIAGGLLQANSSAALGDGSATNTLIFDGGALQATGIITSPATRGVTLNINSTGTIDTNGNTVSLAGVITGGGALTKTGTGTLVLSNAGNNYTGQTTINAGTLQAGAANVIPQASAVVVNSGTFDLNNFNQSIGSLTGEAGTTVSLGSATLTTGTVGAAYSGAINGTGNLVVQGSNNSFTLAGTNGYTGTTTVRGTASGFAQLVVQGSILGSQIINLEGQSARAILGVQNGAGIANTAAVTLSGQAGSLILLNQSTEFGSLNSASANALINFAPGLVLTTGRNGTSDTFAGNIGSDGNGGLTKTGAGTFTLTGANNYTGATTISGGTLRIGDGTNAGDAGRIGQNNAGTVFSNVVTTGGTLTIARTNAYTYGGAISGSGIINQAGSGVTTLTGASTGFSGTANVNAGTLSVNGTLGDGTATVNVNNNGTLRGTGTIGGTVEVNPGGTVSAGNSPGTLAVTNYTANGGGTLFELNQPNVVGGANNDLINVSNLLTVNANSPLTLQTTLGGAPAAGLYRIFTYGALAGSVANFTPAVSGGGTADVYTVNNGVNVRLFGAGQITQYWDGTDQTGATAGAQGGAATWNATNTNWVDDPTAGTINDRWRSQAGVFGNGTTNNAAVARTVTVDGAQSFQSLRFSDNNYTLTAGAGGSLTLVGNPFAAAADQAFSSVTVDLGNTASLNLPITGTGTAGLLKLGAGTLNLGGVNTYAGGTRIDAGTLVIAAGASVASGVTNNAGFGNLGTVNGGVTNTATGVAGNNGTINGGVTNSGGFTNGGTVNNGLTNAGTYTQSAGSTNGGTTNTGTVNANAGAFTGAIANNAGAFNVGGGVTANGTFTNSGTATLSVSAVSSLAGVTVLTNDSTAAAGVTTAAGATLSAGGLAGTTATATISNAGTLNLVGGVGDTSYAGRITGAGPFNKSGAGVQTLTGANAAGAQYTGAAAVTGGTLQINGVFGDTAANAASLTVGAAGTVVGTGTFAGNVTNNGTVAAGAVPGTGQVGLFTIGGNYTINAGSVNAFDLGTPNVVGGPTNDRIAVGGDLTVTGGTLALTNANASGLYRLYDAGGTVTSAAAPNVGFTTVTTANGTAEIYAVAANGAPAPNQVNARVSLGGQIVQYWDGTDTLGIVGGAAGAQGGTGTWNATNTNWTDDPVAGQVNQAWQSQFGVFTTAGGTVTVEGQQNLQGLQFTTNGYTLVAGAAGTLNLTGDPNGLAGFSTIRVDGGVTTTIGTPITGAGLNKAVGSGTLILTGANTFSALNIADGVVDVRGGAAIADAAPVTIADTAGARLLVTESETIGSLAGGGTTGGTVGILAGQTLTTGGNNTSTTFAGTIDGAGGLIKDGTGTFTLSGVNTFEGGTVNQGVGGTLIIAAGGSVASDVTNNAGAIFINNGTVNASHTNNGTSTNNGTINGGVGNGGTFTNNGSVGGRLTNTGTATNTASGTINGGVTNTGGFTNDGIVNAGLINNAGTSNNNGTINGGATVNGGTLSTVGTINGGVVNFATVNAQGTINGNVTNNAGATFTMTGPLASYGNGGATGIVRLTNNGAFNLNGNSLTIGSLAGTVAAATISNGGTLSTGADNTSSEYFGRIVGGGTALTKVGTGTFTLSGNNTYGGVTSIQAGTLAVSGTGVINGSSEIVNAAGFTITAGGQVTTPRVTNTATGTLTTAGTLNATTAITNAGSFTVTAGTVTTPSLSNTGTLSQTGGTIAATAFDNAASGTFTQAAGAPIASVLNTATITNNGSFTSAGTVGATTSITNAGSFTVTAGTVTTPSLSNTGTLSQTGGTIAATAFANQASGIYTQTAAGTLNASTISNAGRFTSAGPVNATTSFTNAATGVLAASGTITTPTFVNAGTVNGLLTLAGVSQITNQAGALIRDGVSGSAAAGGARLDNAGTIGTGGLVINTAAGTLNAFNTSGRTFFGYVSSAAGTTSTFTNTATGRWDYQGVGNLAGTDTIVNQGLFSVTAAGGTLNGLERFDNQAGGQVVLNASLGGPIGVFDNAGTVGIPAASSFNGSLGSNTFNNLAGGTISLQNTPPGSVFGSPNYRVTDSLTLAGNYAGSEGSRIAIDVDLSRSDAGIRGDRLIVAGTDSGSSLLNLNVVNSGRVFFSTPIPVVQAGGGSLRLQVDPTTPLPTTGFIGYTLQETPGSAGSYQIVSQIAAGQAAAPGASISGLITALNVGFFQSISAFISGPAEHRICTPELRSSRLCDQPDSTASVGVTSSDKSWAALNRQAAAAPVAADANVSGILPDTFGLGLWARGSGGETTIRSASSSTSAGITNIGQNRTRIGFAGMQFGGDFAVFNLRNSGFNLHMGVTGGEIYADGRELQSSQATGVFNVPFIGTYAALTSGAFTSDISYRHDFYNARISDPTSGVFAQRLPIGSDTVAGSAGYRIDLPGLFGGDQAYFLEPSGSVSYTETRVGTLGVTGGTLSFQPIDSVLGRFGFRAGTTFVAGDKLALQPFATASVWNEFAGNAASRFTAASIATDPNAFVPILTNRIGTFGQVGLGITGQLLGTDLLGYVRADLRFGDRIDGYSFNGGVRYPF